MGNDPLEIPAFLDRRDKKLSVKTRAIGTEAQHRREAHRIAVSCRKLLEKARKRRARERRRRQPGGVA
jgi:hypothetical protein